MATAPTTAGASLSGGRNLQAELAYLTRVLKAPSLHAAVDRLGEGDTVISLFPDDEGGLQPGPEVKVDVLPGGTETLALAEERPGRRLDDLPRF